MCRAGKASFSENGIENARFVFNLENSSLNLGETNMAAPQKSKSNFRNQGYNPADQASDVATTIGQKAGEVISSVAERADEATSAFGAHMQSWAGAIRENNPSRAPSDSAADAVANTLESGGRYLREQGLSGLGADVTQLIRRNPVPAVLIGIALGYLVARGTNRI
jgi:hypothetical protein